MKARALFFLVATNVLGGASYLATAHAIPYFQGRPFLVVFLRTFLGLLLFAPFLVRAFKTLKLTRGEWLRLGIVGVFAYAAPVILGTVGQGISSSTNAALMIGVEPVSVVFLSSLFLGERLNFMKIGAIGFGLCGVTFIVLQGVPFYNATITPHLQGDLLLFAHAICWSLYSVIGKPLLHKVDPMSFTSLTTLFGFVPITLFAVRDFSGFVILPIPGETVAALLFLGIGVTFVATCFWNMALELVPASQLANFIFLQPLVGVILGVFFQKEPFSIWSALGGALILAAVFLATRSAPE